MCRILNIQFIAIQLQSIGNGLGNRAKIRTVLAKSNQNSSRISQFSSFFNFPVSEQAKKMLAILLQIIFAVGIIFQRLAIEMPFLITGLTLIVTLIFIISYWKIKRSAKLKPCQEDFSRRSFIEDLDTSIATSTSDDSEESEAEEHDELINQDSGLASTIASNNSSLNRYAIKMLDRNKKRFTILKEYGKLCDLTENSSLLN